MNIHNVEQRSRQWLDLRAGRVTATDFKSLVMGKTTKGYQELIGRIVAEILFDGIDEDHDDFVSSAMERGQEMEPLARTDLSESLGGYIQEAGFVTPDGPFEDWVGVSPDGLLAMNHEFVAGIEIKCPAMKTHIRYFGADLPGEYLHQVQASLWVTGLPMWYFVSWYPGLKRWVLPVYPDHVLHEQYEAEIIHLISEAKDRIQKYKEYDG